MTVKRVLDRCGAIAVLYRLALQSGPGRRKNCSFSKSCLEAAAKQLSVLTGFILSVRELKLGSALSGIAAGGAAPDRFNGINGGTTAFASRENDSPYRTCLQPVDTADRRAQ